MSIFETILKIQNFLNISTFSKKFSEYSKLSDNSNCYNYVTIKLSENSELSNNSDSFALSKVCEKIHMYAIFMHIY